jgi:hypothetical protein
MPGVLSTQKVEIGKIMVQGQPEQNPISIKKLGMLSMPVIPACVDGIGRRMLV